MAKLKICYVVPYNRLPQDVRLELDELDRMRTGRIKGALGLKTGGLRLPLKVHEHVVQLQTRNIGELSRRKELMQFIDLPAPKTPHHEEITTRGLAQWLTHVHVDRNKNLVFTREAPKYKGKEIIPRALKPATWRFRMKVPTQLYRLG